MRDEDRLSLKDCSWDLLRLIMDYCPKAQVYPVLKGVNREFHRLVQHRVRGLCFTQPAVTSKMFLGLL